MDIEKLLQNEEFKAQLENAKDFKEAAEIYNAYGIDVTEEELKEIIARNESGELGEEALEDVAGGTVLWGPWRPLPFPRWPGTIPIPFPRWPRW